MDRMNDSIVREICQETVEPLNDKLNVLVERLVTKDDLKDLLASIHDSVSNQISNCFNNFQHELESRDAKITSLEYEVDALKQANYELNNIVSKQIEKVDKIENDVRDLLHNGPQVSSEVRNESFATKILTTTPKVTKKKKRRKSIFCA